MRGGAPGPRSSGQALEEGTMGVFVIVAYRPHPGREAELLQLVREHLPVLRREGLATERAPLVMRAGDGAIVEVFEWASREAVERAHASAAVQALWGRFAKVCAYAPLADLREAGELFAHFEPVEPLAPPRLPPGFAGDWRLRPDRSRYEDGPPPARASYHIEARGEDVRFAAEWLDRHGQEQRMGYTLRFDAGGDVTLTLVDERTLDTAVKRGGEVVAHARRVLSEDGATLTITQSSTSPDGKTVANVAVYERI